MSRKSSLFFCKEEEYDSYPLIYKYSNRLLVWGLILLLCYYAFTYTDYSFNFAAVYAYKEKFISGFGVTIAISIAALILSLIIGGFFAYAQKSTFVPLRIFAKIYIEIIRGTPLLVQILIFFYVFATSFGFDNRYIVGVFIMALFSGAYVSEIVRAGVESIEKGQHEASLALNLGTFDKYRLIILPQAYKRIIPPLTGQFANLIKDSSLLSIISIREFTMNAQEVNAYTYSTLESYIPLALGYLLLTYPISSYSRYLEQRYSY